MEPDVQSSTDAPEPRVAALGPDAVLDALARVRQGRIFDLGTDLEATMPQGPRTTFGGFRLTQYRIPTCLYGSEPAPPFDFAMEVIEGSPHLGSHIDALSHIQAHGKVYGGQAVADVYGDFGWEANGVHTLPPIVTHGVLLDVAGAFGVDCLEDGFGIGPEELERCLAAQGTELRPGGVVLVRVGKIAQFKAGDEAYMLSHAGVTREGAVWLYERGMVAIGTDTTATEPFPFPDVERTVHVALLVERGIPIMEILDLDELARERAYEFLFVCTPLRFVGATGSWVRPLAVV